MLDGALVTANCRTFDAVPTMRLASVLGFELNDAQMLFSLGRNLAAAV